MTEVACPFCQTTVRVAGAGEFRCPSCAGTFAVDAVPAPAPPADGAPAPAPAPDSAPAAASAPAAPPPLTNAPPCALHPQSPAVAFCSRCGNFACAECRVERAGATYCSECAGKVPSPDDPIPWEDPRVGLLPALVETVKLALTNGPALFRRMRREGGYWRPLQFYLLTSVPVGVLSLATQYALRDILLSPMSEMDLAAGFGALCLSPLIVALTAAFYHLSVRIMGGTGSIETTFRIVCYGTGGPSPLMLVPLAGQLIGGIWQFVLFYRGYRIAHEMSAGRALLALLVVPLALVCGIGIFTAVVIGIVAAVLR